MIELLVVIAIIALLAALLLPALRKAKENARRARCVSNMRQIDLAVMSYTMDYNETYPFFEWSNGWNTPGEWGQWVNGDRLKPYLKSPKIFECPSFVREPWQTGPVRYDYFFPDHCWFPGNITVYGCLDWYGSPPVRPARISEVKAPVSVISGFEAGLDHPIGTGNVGWFAPLYFIFSPHSGGCNFAFADGHVQWYKTENMQGSDLDPTSTELKSAKISMRKDYVP